MPQADKTEVTLPTHDTLEGRVLTIATPADITEVLRLAFDYRGDVTVHLRDGSTVDGFLFNHNAQAGIVQIFATEGKDSVQRELDAAAITSIHFTGADKAFGKSWDDWNKKNENERAKIAAAEKLKAEALGHL
jgi:exosome complex RNA-binding protein Csl4